MDNMEHQLRYKRWDNYMSCGKNTTEHSPTLNSSGICRICFSGQSGNGLTVGLLDILVVFSNFTNSTGSLVDEAQTETWVLAFFLPLFTRLE